MRTRNDRGSIAFPVSGSLNIPGSERGTRLGAVQVNVVDYKPFISQEGIDPSEMQAIRDDMRKLIDNLRSYTNFMTPGDDKVAANIQLANNQIGTHLALLLELGKLDDPFIKRVNIPLPRKFHGRMVSTLHDALVDLGQVDPGGNIPNMTRNMVHAMQSGLFPDDGEIDLFTTPEPIYLDWLDHVDSSVRDRVKLTRLQIPHRVGIHVPYTSDKPGGVGTFGMVTPMHSTIANLATNFDTLRACNHVLVSESLSTLVQSDEQRRQFREFQNPSSAFREQCALENYNQMLNRGRMPIISMNDEEMVKYLLSIERRRALSNTSPSSSDEVIQTPSFSSPFDGNRAINDSTIDLVNNGFSRYLSSITPHPEDSLYFPASVSSGPFGGYHLACTPDGNRYVVFSSTPNGTGTERMLSLVGDNEDIDIKKKHTMGAGDSVASVLSLTQLWNLDRLMKEHSQNRYPLDPKFSEVASMIFVSLLSRFAGEILYHSDRCDWSSVPTDRFPQIVKTIIEKSLKLASDTWNKTEQTQVFREPDWDIDLALWQLR